MRQPYRNRYLPRRGLDQGYYRAVQVLDGVNTSDQYDAAATLGPIYPSNGGSFSILNEPVYASTQTGVPGNFQWSPDIPISPGTGFTIPAGCTGIRFRSYTPGAPANVSAWIAGKADAAPQGGTPGKVTLTALNFLHNGTLVANEQGLNLADSGGIVWTVSDDPAAQRVDVYATPQSSEYKLLEVDASNSGSINLPLGSGGTWSLPFKFYKIIWVLLNLSGDYDCYFKVNNSTGNYYNYWTNDAQAGIRSATGVNYSIAGVVPSSTSYGEGEIIVPVYSSTISCITRWSGFGTSGYFRIGYGGVMINYAAMPITSFQLYPNSGTWDGYVELYGIL